LVFAAAAAAAAAVLAVEGTALMLASSRVGFGSATLSIHLARGTSEASFGTVW
jgi:hypothetical protein